MKLSKRGEYALRALIDLGIAAELGRPILQVSELAAKEKLDRKFLFRGQFTDLEKGPSQFGGDAEINERAQWIFATFGKLHATQSRSRWMQQL